ncbi:unnamed protein product [Schistocephalus solidus]|uniref:Uncharacterized protein n=1 Tax=Schistocephalus solidus TaxID=70667 RepID=A0A183T691_SCHSO|nr:unnamed protein product [Schistocephalus solidus]
MAGNATVATSSCYPSLICGSSKLVLPSGHTTGKRHDQREKQREGHRCCVCLHPVPPLLFPSHCPLPFFFFFFFFFFSSSSRPSFLLSLLLSCTLTSSLLTVSSPFSPPPHSK